MADLTETESVTLLTEVLSSGDQESQDYEEGNSSAEPEAEPTPNIYKKILTYKNQKVEVRADLIFEFIKTHMNEAQVDELKTQAQTLGKLLVRAKATGQDGFCDELRVKIARCLREQEYRARGYGRWIPHSDITRLMKVSNVRLSLVPLRNFPRPIPSAPAAIIQNLLEAKVFDKFAVLHMDPTGEQALSFSERIKRKDPILFGVSGYDDDRLFYITDWVDEVCDLTMDKLLTAIHDYDVDFKLSEVPEVTESQLAQEVQIAEERMARFKATGPRTYHGDLAVTALEDQEFSWKLVGRVIRALWRSIRKKWSRDHSEGSVPASSLRVPSWWDRQ